MPRSPKQRQQQKAVGRPEHLKPRLEAYRADRDLAIREFYRIESRDDPSTLVFFHLNPLQKALSQTIDRARALNEKYSIDTKLKIVIGKHRRGGVSSYLIAAAHTRANFLPNTHISLVAHLDDTAEELMRFVDRFHEHWPDRNDAQSFKEELVTDNRGLKQWANGSSIQVGSAGGKSIRGGKSDILILTEYAWYDDYEPSTALLRQASPHAMIFKETTANGTGNAFHRDWKGAFSVDEVEALYQAVDRGGDEAKTALKALQKWNGYYKFFFGWVDDPGLVQPLYNEAEEEEIRTGLSAEEQRLLRVRPGLTAGQLKWRRKEVADMEAQTGLTPEAYFAQENPATEEDLFQGSGRTVFDRGALARLNALSAAVTPRAVITVGRDFKALEALRGGENFWMRLQPEPGTDYAIGADPCNGVPGGDWGVVDVYSRTDGTVLDQVAHFRDRFPASDLADIACALSEMYNGAFLTPEGGNGPGTAFCQRVFDNNYMRFYRRERLGRSDALSDDANSFMFGFMTENREVKALLIDTLSRGITQGTVLVYHPRTLHELSVFAEHERTKRLAAPLGDYDDCVTASGLALIGHVRQAGPVSLRAPKAKQEPKTIDEILNRDMQEAYALWDKRNSKGLQRGRRSM